MGTPGNAAAGIDDQHEELLADPEGQRNGRGQGQRDADEHQNPDAHLRMQQEIGGDDT
ncbi:hypothetical protein D9M70_558290 [compost metagenome]